MTGLFYNYTKSEILNSSSFDTSKVASFCSMFCNCKSLKSLDLSNFITSNAIEMPNIFIHALH